MLADSAEGADLPRWGLASLTDLETGRRRLAVMRPALYERWQRHARERQAALAAVCARHARPLTRLTDRLDSRALWEALSA